MGVACLLGGISLGQHDYAGDLGWIAGSPELAIGLGAASSSMKAASTIVVDELTYKTFAEFFLRLFLLRRIHGPKWDDAQIQLHRGSSEMEMQRNPANNEKDNEQNFIIKIAIPIEN